MWGQIATMGYAVFGLPIFMLWLSNVGTLLAQTFTFLYANVCCFICRRGKRKKGSKINSILVSKRWLKSNMHANVPISCILEVVCLFCRAETQEARRGA